MKKVRLASLVGRFRPNAKLRGFKDPRRRVKEAPVGWFSTAEVCRMLSISRRSVRQLLHRHDVDWRMVEREGACAIIYWEREGVLDYVKRVGGDAETLERVPDGWMLRREAEALLGIPKSTMCRMVQRGQLSESRRRLVEGNGSRCVCMLRCEEVLRLAQERRSALMDALARLPICVCAFFANAVMAWALVVDATVP